MSLLRTDANIGEGAEACVDAIYNFKRIFYHFENSLSTFGDKLPGLVIKFDFEMILNDIIKNG